VGTHARFELNRNDQKTYIISAWYDLCHAPVMKILAAIAMLLLLVAQPLRAADGDAADPLAQRMAR
jgi:hypothetical protein